jgi:DNA polymerase III alpha subunit
MIHLALQTEFSFKKSFLHMKDIHNYVEDGYVGIADLNNTYGHIPLSKEAKEHGFTPIYGVRLHVLPDDSVQRVCNVSWIFIAKNGEGLLEIYRLVQRAYENFYYIPKLNESDVEEVSQNVYVIAPSDRNNIQPDYISWGQGCENKSRDVDNIAIITNHFPRLEDRPVYELLAGARKNGSGYSHMFEANTYPQHIMNEEEWLVEYDNEVAINNAKIVASLCKVELPQAEMVKWSGSHDILGYCRDRQKKVKDWDDVYEERLLYEINLIEEKGYVDYFMIVADLIEFSKKKMFIGPARGSSAGSLVCYLMGITEVDPVEHSLIFERFIDINRFDLPDIDIDFPDVKRDIAVKYLKHKYGRDKVMCLANVNRLKAKSAIGEFAKSLGVPSYETSAVKDAIIERSSADARAKMCIKDTFETTEPGKLFIEKYPAMAMVEDIEGHASHAGKHAAGIIVSTLPLSTYGSLNPRDEVVMIDRWGAEEIDLLKIDCLGLRTLSILEETANLLCIPYQAFYTLPLDDKPTYDLFNAQRLSGVFQFEGQALQMIVKQMGVHDFNDISAITALARPGALNSGGTAKYIKYSTTDEEPHYYSDVHKDITGATYGSIVYQEQMMEIARRIGGMSWEDVSTLRKASSKSYGDEFFGKYKDMFVEGAIANGYDPDDSVQMWVDISASGSWTFNKSHAVSYGLISYWTAYCKANHPMEFAVASLNNAGDIDNARKLLRDFIKHEDMQYVAVDSDLSDIKWSVHDDVLVGGLTNIKGIGVKKAEKIIKARSGKDNLTPSLFKALANPVTEFDILFPCDHYWGHLYRDPKSYQLDGTPQYIETVDGRGEYIIIGCLVDRNLRDLNEHVFLTQRDGEIITEDNLYLNFKLADDTDMISCKISRWKYEQMGRSIAETGREGLDWYMVRGKINSDWRRIDAAEVVNLNQYFNVEIK